MYRSTHGPIRKPAKWSQIINPLWLMSDDERNKNYTWFGIRPIGWFRWFLRNPCTNLFTVVLGISHRTRMVYFVKGEGWTYVDGLNYGYSVAAESALKLPFISYRGKRFECMAGWKTSGGVDIQFRRANSPNAAAY